MLQIPYRAAWPKIFGLIGLKTARGPPTFSGLESGHAASLDAGPMGYKPRSIPACQESWSLLRNESVPLFFESHRLQGLLVIMFRELPHKSGRAI